MPKYSTPILLLLLLIAWVWCLTPLYNSADGLQHPLVAGCRYLGLAIVMGVVMIKAGKAASLKLAIMNGIIMAFFIVLGVLLTLICLYSLEAEGHVDSLASAVFFLGAMIAGSSMFFVTVQKKVMEN